MSLPQGPKISLATRCVRAGRTPDPTFGSLVPPLHQTPPSPKRVSARTAGSPTPVPATPPWRRSRQPWLPSRTRPLPWPTAAAWPPSRPCSWQCSRAATGSPSPRPCTAARCAWRGRSWTPWASRPPSSIPRAPRTSSAPWPASRGSSWWRAPPIRRWSWWTSPAIARAAQERGALLAVDNTFQTPVGLRPLDLGADVSIYSTTKFIEGSGATVGGALVTRDEHLAQRLRRFTKSMGCAQAPFEAWLTLRGLATLPLRFEQHCEHALRVAEALERAPGAERVRHPGLASFPQGELARRQHLGGARGQLHGAIVTFEVAGGYEAAKGFLAALSLVIVAENLGTPETLATHPASMTHPDVPQEQRAAAGIGDGLVRLSIGLEDPAEIIADLEAALEHAQVEVPA